MNVFYVFSHLHVFFLIFVTSFSVLGVCVCLPCFCAVTPDNSQLLRTDRFRPEMFRVFALLSVS